MSPSALLRSHRSSRSKVGQQSVGIDGSKWSARVLEHDGRRQLLLDVLCRVVRSGQSRWERSRRARRQAAERPSSWQWKARSQEGSNGVGSQVRSVGEDWRIIGRCTDCWYSERVAEIEWCRGGLESARAVPQVEQCLDAGASACMGR